MSILSLSLAGLFAGTAGALLAAGIYTERHHAPDQP
jgi:hypothetical protein